jgi:DNA-binding Lrp family transcriptional regulator
MLTGGADFIIKVVAHDFDDYQNFLTTKLTPAPNVKEVKTSIVIRTAKHLPGAPVEAD